VTDECDVVSVTVQGAKVALRAVTTRQRFQSINFTTSKSALPTMDRLESLGNTISNLTMYDIKSMYTQVRVQPFARDISARVIC
jgi:hypothetical protein